MSPPDRTPQQRAAHAFPIVADWLLGEPMTALLRVFDERQLLTGDEADGPGTLDEALPEWLERALHNAATGVADLSADNLDILRRTVAIERAADIFNFRARAGDQYTERHHAAVADFDAGLRDRVLGLTADLGLVRPEPTRFQRYDKTLVLGGGYRSPLLRARYAAQLQAAGVDLGELGFLGSPRPLIEKQPLERPVVQEYAPDAVDEFDLMVGAARAAFGVRAAAVTFPCGCSSAEEFCPTWLSRWPDPPADTPAAFTHERRVDLLDGSGMRVGSAFSASTSRPPYRPDTSDTLGMWARCADPQPGQAILMVTTQVFVPFQRFDGFRRLYLPYGVEVDAVGFGPDWGDRPYTAEYLLQEVLSAIHSARRLLVDAASLLAGAA